MAFSDTDLVQATSIDDSERATNRKSVAGYGFSKTSVEASILTYAENYEASPEFFARTYIS